MSTTDVKNRLIINNNNNKKNINKKKPAKIADNCTATVRSYLNVFRVYLEKIERESKPTDDDGNLIDLNFER